VILNRAVRKRDNPVEIYLIALTPLLLAVTGLTVALPIGLHFANKERTERAARQAAEAAMGISIVWPPWAKYPVPLHWAANVIVPSGIYDTALINPIASPATPKQSKVQPDQGSDIPPVAAAA
jgi:hypothetical protein